LMCKLAKVFGTKARGGCGACLKLGFQFGTPSDLPTMALVPRVGAASRRESWNPRTKLHNSEALYFSVGKLFPVV
jgi:hypothetical protein